VAKVALHESTGNLFLSIPLLGFLLISRLADSLDFTPSAANFGMTRWCHFDDNLGHYLHSIMPPQALRN
jgi:hypothetical protein